jgi:hypothetical protein
MVEAFLQAVESVPSECTEGLPSFVEAVDNAEGSVFWRRKPALNHQMSASISPTALARLLRSIVSSALYSIAAC